MDSLSICFIFAQLLVNKSEHKVIEISNGTKSNIQLYAHDYYTIYNEKYFQKLSFCVITHPER